LRDESSIASQVRDRESSIVNTASPVTRAAIAIAVIEDEERQLEALTFQLGTAGYGVVGHPSAESFLETPGSTDFDCVVADICLPRMNGLQLLAEIKKSAPFASIILVTGQGSMTIGVQALREGAIDCLEKPIDDEALLNAIRRGTKLSRIQRAEHLRRLQLKQRANTLTPREREVFALITSGLLNKQAGAKLGATERTIKTHRGRVMTKMGADSLADLVRMAEILQIQPFIESREERG
jgi:two-component system, LuxR family, response regulator FixJ